jgi:geranylgeranylglycerol-phosphate geranylgeranyltransferase
VALDLLRLCRPVAALCAGAQVLVGAHLNAGANAPSPGNPVLLRTCVVIALVVATINAVNDIVDVPADRISQPTRPLAAGRVSTPTAWCLACVSGLAAVALSIGIPAGVLVTVGLVIAGLCYDFLLKGTVVVGNLVVALLASTPVIYGGWLGGADPAGYLLAALVICLYMFAFEVLKTIRDEAADRAAAYRTVATAWGPGVAAALYRAALMAYALAAASPLVLLPVSWGYGLIMLLGAVLPPLFAGWTKPVGRSPAAVRFVLRLMALCWFPGLAAFALEFR